MIWVLLACGAACAEEPEPSTLHLKLEEAVRVALVKSPRIKQVLARLKIAQEQVEIAAAPSRTYLVHLHTCTPVHLYTCAPVHLYTCTSVHLYICTPVHLYT